MKLIIDIPKEVKEAFDNAKNEDLYGNYYDRNSLIGKAIQNGIPLDDVLEKIKGYIDHIRNTGMGKKKSLEFIEKFIEGLMAESGVSHEQD